MSKENKFTITGQETLVGFSGSKIQDRPTVQDMIKLLERYCAFMAQTYPDAKVPYDLSELHEMAKGWQVEN